MTTWQGDGFLLTTIIIQCVKADCTFGRGVDEGVIGSHCQPTLSGLLSLPTTFSRQKRQARELPASRTLHWYNEMLQKLILLPRHKVLPVLLQLYIIWRVYNLCGIKEHNFLFVSLFKGRSMFVECLKMLVQSNVSKVSSLRSQIPSIFRHCSSFDRDLISFWKRNNPTVMTC